MDMGQAISSGFRNYVRFSGRAGRAEYWWWILFTVVVGIALSIVDMMLGTGAMAPISGLFNLVVFLPSLAVLWRRLHDIGRPGYYGFLPILTFPLFLLGGVFEQPGLFIVGGIAAFGLSILLLVWLIRRGDPGPNAYGSPPVQGP